MGMGFGSMLNYGEPIHDWKASAEEANLKLADLISLDEQDKRQCADWHPIVNVRDGKNGNWVIYENVEFCAPYTESITCTPGEAPKTHLGYKDVEAWPAFPSTINIRSLSGNVISIQISRHKADFLLAALLEAWRANR